jgi:hypothetical protein
MYRQLYYKLSDDNIQFNNMLIHYLNFEKNRLKPIYDFNYVKSLVEWFKDKFEKCDPKDFVVIGRFDQFELTEIYIAYKIKISYNRNDVDDLFPYYVSGFVYYKEKKLLSPHDSLQNLSFMAAKIFEKQGFVKSFLVTKAPIILLKNNLDENKLYRILNNIWPNPLNRVNLNIEGIFRDQNEIDKYNFKGIYSILPKKIIKPVVLCSWILRPNEILKNKYLCND